MEEPSRYTTREMLGIESRLAERALEMADRPRRRDQRRARERVLERHDYLSQEQREAVRHITGERQIEALTGFAGSRQVGGDRGGARAVGRGRLPGPGARRYRASRPRTWSGRRGAQPHAGIIGAGLAARPGAACRTRRVVLDEAGMVGSRQMERIVSEVHERGAKLVLVGDAEQLQPIEAGAAFRAIAERVGYRELAGIRRQHEEWQREASRDFARGEPGRALELYQEHEAIHFAANAGARQG